MNILITGGCGFIGTNLVKKVLGTNCENRLRIVDNLRVGSIDNIASFCEINKLEEKNIDAKWNIGVDLITGDITDLPLSKKICHGADVIIHLAANTGVVPSINDPVSDCMNNVIGTLNYLEAAKLNNVGRFIFASSGAPLGRQNPPIHEEMAPKPQSPYGASKLAGEGYCSAYYGAFGVATTALRFGNVYGPNSTHKGSVVAKFIKHIFAGEDLPIYGDGNQTRDFIYIDDLIDAINLTLECPDTGGEIFQIATNKEHTVIEIANTLNTLAQKHIGKQSQIIFKEKIRGEVPRNFSDISKAQKVIGYHPKYTLEEGLEKTLLWFIDKLQNHDKL